MFLAFVCWRSLLCGRAERALAKKITKKAQTDLCVSQNKKAAVEGDVGGQKLGVCRLVKSAVKSRWVGVQGFSNSNLATSPDVVTARSAFGS